MLYLIAYSQDELGEVKVGNEDRLWCVDTMARLGNNVVAVIRTHKPNLNLLTDVFVSEAAYECDGFDDAWRVFMDAMW